MKKLAAVAAVFALGLTGCPGDAPAPRPAQQGGTIEHAINYACKSDQIVQVAMATENVGSGSRTDYWLVLCQPRSGFPYVVRVEV